MKIVNKIKKYIISALIAIVMLVAVGYGVKTSMNNDIQLSDLAKANIEALAGMELPEVVIICSQDIRGRCRKWVTIDITSCGLEIQECRFTGNTNDPGC